MQSSVDVYQVASHKPAGLGSQFSKRNISRGSMVTVNSHADRQRICVNMKIKSPKTQLKLNA